MILISTPLFPARNAAFMVSCIEFNHLIRASFFRLNREASYQSALREITHDYASSWTTSDLIMLV
jgi:hypothetical protein